MKKKILLIILFFISFNLYSQNKFSVVRENKELEFPKDFGSHKNFKIEWWYVTGWLDMPNKKNMGFQITFFRYSTKVNVKNTSSFLPKNIIIGHAALSDIKQDKLLYSQKIGREGFNLVYAKENNTDIKLHNWEMKKIQNGNYLVNIFAEKFNFNFNLQPTQKILLQGNKGFSQKGPLLKQASYYYSEPQLIVSGEITYNGKKTNVSGKAWLDHEWSSSILDPNALGWDWLGINLNDGGVITVFKIRGKKGQDIWRYAIYRSANGNLQKFSFNEIKFQTLETWRSKLTGTIYPISMEIHLGSFHFKVFPLQNNQEFDSRKTTGSVYWEGAILIKQKNQIIGKGYLELTGYYKPMKL